MVSHSLTHLARAAWGSASHCSLLTQNSSLCRMMSASTEPPENTACLRCGGTSTRSFNLRSPSLSPCTHNQKVISARVADWDPRTASCHGGGQCGNNINSMMR